MHGKFLDSKEAKAQSFFIGKLWLKSKVINEVTINSGLNYYSRNQVGISSDYHSNVDYLNTYLEYSKNDWKVTAGFQNVIWGKLDEISPNDKLSRENFSDYLLRDKPERLLGNLLISINKFWGNHKIQFLYGPSQKEHLLPNDTNIWSPINYESGQIQGFPTNQSFSEVLKVGKIKTTRKSSDLIGIRADLQISTFDIGINYASLINLYPTVYLNQDYVNTILKGAPVASAIATYQNELIIRSYDKISFFGIDNSFAYDKSVFKQEASLTLDKITTLKNFKIIKHDRLDYGFAWEYQMDSIPINLNFQINGYSLFVEDEILEQKSDNLLSLQLEYLLFSEQLKIKWRSIYSFSASDSLNRLRISYTGFNYLNLYTDLFYFSGKENTTQGFHKNHSLLVFGLKGEF